MKHRITSIFILLAILGLAASLRFIGMNWDQGHHLHPDERFILMTVEKLDFQKDMNPHFFAYGSFPLYLLKILGTMIHTIHPFSSSYDALCLIGRCISALFDIGTTAVLYFIVRQLSKKKYAVWIAAFWYAVSVLPIQLSHFYAVDTMLTFFITLTLFFLLRYFKHPRIRYALGIGIACGLALATKISAAVVCIPIAVTFIFLFKQQWKRTLLHAGYAVVAAVYIFFIGEPFAFLDFNTFIHQIREQQAMTKSAFTFPYTLQYVGKIPYLYEFKNILLWGQGIPLGILSLVGTIYITIQSIKEKNAPVLILLSFFWVYTGTVGKFAVGFMRYMLPVYPLLTIFAALLIQKCTQTLSKKTRAWVYGILSGMMLLWAWTFMAIYTVPNTRITATNWIKKNIQSHETIATEHWDDGLPLGVASDYTISELPFYEADTVNKWKYINKTLENTDYIIIASNRLYVPLIKMTNCSKLPEGRCYKTTASYYHQLFQGTLGFTLVATFEVYPTVPFINIQIPDSSADESFTVYDHPKIMIFKKTGVFQPVQLEE